MANHQKISPKLKINMHTYIFDLNSTTDNDEQYRIEVKVCTQTLDNDHPSIDKNSDDIECERKDCLSPQLFGQI